MADTYHVKDHVVREVVNRLRDTALEFHAHGSLRERLARELEPLLVASRPAEVDDEGLPPLPPSDPELVRRFGPPTYTVEQYRQGQRDAVAAYRAWNEKPVAYAVVSKKGGIHKLCITRPSAERKAAVWQEEWPDNGCTVRPLVFGDSAPSHTTNKEK